jgi:hypothetical protein
MSTFTANGTENRMRWDQRSRGFMEVWYATVSHRESGDGLWLRYTLTAPLASVGDPYCELWAFNFDADGKRSFAAKQRFGIDSLGSANGRDDGALARIANSWLSETHLEGRVDSDDGYLSWSLDIEPATRTFQHLPPPIRKRAERSISTVCSPNLSVPFTGVVDISGEQIVFEGDPGCQSHRWGRKHSRTWSWAHCSSFGEGRALFEGVAARSDFGFLPGPTMTFLYLEYEGEELAFNDVRGALRAKSRYEMPTWAFTASNDRWRIAGAARAHPEQLVQVAYADPDGSPRYCANSEIADLGIEIYERRPTGWRHAGSLTSLGGAHVEFGRPDPFDELPIAF